MRLATLEFPADAEDAIALDAACEETREEEADNVFCTLDEAMDGGSAIDVESAESNGSCESASDEESCDNSSACDIWKEDAPFMRVVTLANTWAVSGTKGGA